MTQSSAPIDERTHFPPMKPVDFLILLSLVEHDLHGYGVLLEVERSSRGEVRLDAGNLYRSLRRLMAGELVERLDAAAAQDSEERRRYYRLTDLGRRAVAAEARRMRDLLRLASARHLLAEPS